MADFAASIAHAVLGVVSAAGSNASTMLHLSEGEGLVNTMSPGPRPLQFVMKAKVIADSTERRWTVQGTPDNSATQAPLAPGLLAQIGVDSTLR